MTSALGIIGLCIALCRLPVFLNLLGPPACLFCFALAARKSDGAYEHA
jgi:hypothetical protein